MTIAPMTYDDYPAPTGCFPAPAADPFGMRVDIPSGGGLFDDWGSGGGGLFDDWGEWGGGGGLFDEEEEPWSVLDPWGEGGDWLEEQLSDPWRGGGGSDWTEPSPWSGGGGGWEEYDDVVFNGMY